MNRTHHHTINSTRRLTPEAYFAPACGIEEDPVCGSGNDSVAAFRQHYKLLERQETTYIARQGQKVGRNGKITVNYSADGQISIGGSCITTVDGKLKI